jgi:hypothetical protein
MKPLILVHFSRLESGLFGSRQGDISAAYCAERFHGKSTPVVSVFTHQGRWWINGGCCSGLGFSYAECYQLILPQVYRGPDSVPYSHEGETVLYRRAQYRLGPKTEFRAADRTVPEWQDYLQRLYCEGGYFTHDKTYHDLLREYADRQNWDMNSRSFKGLSGNIVQAFKLELAKPDFDKRETNALSPDASAPDQQMELITV